MKIGISLESENKNLTVIPTDEFVGETVRIVFPNETFEGKPDRFIKSHAKNMNAKVTIQPDRTVVFTMLSTDRDKVVNKLKKDISEDTGLLTDGKWKVDFVKNTVFNNDYTEMTIYVDSVKYNSATKTALTNFDLAGFAYDCGRIQLYNGILRDDISVEIIIRDYENDNEIERQKFPK